MGDKKKQPPAILPPDFDFGQKAAPATLPPDFDFGEKKQVVPQSVLDNLQKVSANPTQFEIDRPGSNREGGGFMSNYAGFFGDLLTPSGDTPLPGRSNAMPVNIGEMMARNRVSKAAAQRGQYQREQGYNPAYRTMAPFVPGSARMEDAAAKGDTKGVYGAAAAPVTAAAAAYTVPKVIDALPSKTRAGQNFAAAKAAAGDAPIPIEDVSATALRTSELSQAGGSMPKVIRDFLKRVTDPNKGPMTYSEARDFYSNATRLSADEFNRLTPVMRKQVAEFTRNLGSAIGETAEGAGVGPQYRSAMKEYKNASKLEASKSAALDAFKQALVKGVPTAGALYALHKILNPSSR